MQVWTVRDLGAAIRARRRELGWSQTELANTVGVTRQWVSAMEQGKRTAEIALVLRTLTELGMVADIVKVPKPPHAGIDLDELLGRHRA